MLKVRDGVHLLMWGHFADTPRVWRFVAVVFDRDFVKKFEEEARKLCAEWLEETLTDLAEKKEEEELAKRLAEKVRRGEMDTYDAVQEFERETGIEVEGWVPSVDEKAVEIAFNSVSDEIAKVAKFPYIPVVVVEELLEGVPEYSCFRGYSPYGIDVRGICGRWYIEGMRDLCEEYFCFGMNISPEGCDFLMKIVEMLLRVKKEQKPDGILVFAYWWIFKEELEE